MTGDAVLLAVEDLRTSFRTDRGEARAVDGVDFTIREEEALGIVGESGCGKTVTALSLLGLVPRPGSVRPGSSVRFRGEELIGAPAGRLRRIRGGEIAMIFQEPMTSLNPVYTVGDQILEAIRLHTDLSAEEARRRAVELLGEVGIADPRARASAHPHELSGGMRQRVMIAMALAGDPSLLIADEPTTALDVTVQAQILALMERLRRDRRMAILLITHDLGVVAEVCDRVAVMYAGRVVESASVGQIFDAPLHPYSGGLLSSLPRLARSRGPETRTGRPEADVGRDEGGDGRGVGGVGKGAGDAGTRRRLEPIPGRVPPPTDWPEGCRFRDRCPHAWSRCASEPSLLSPGSGGGVARGARCWLVDEPERRRGARGS